MLVFSLLLTLFNCAPFMHGCPCKLLIIPLLPKVVEVARRRGRGCTLVSVLVLGMGEPPAF